MKKLSIISFLFLALLFGTNLKSQAQNVQLFYDLERECATSTVEMFKPDSFGSTFFFIDMNYSPKVTEAYWEIAREFNFWQNSNLSWLSIHAEYNGGMNSLMSFNNAWLAGLTYSGHSQDFTKTWSLSVMYKAIPGTINSVGKKETHNFQITGVWGIQFLQGWCSFSGFIDFWREARPWQGTNFILISEPQFWVNLNKIQGMEDVNLSIGGELELSNNFVEKGFRAMPALGAKWTF
ncbi:MAG: DUF5020 family protein [Bacteroidales bacterium]|nr:DUF5020 family protein [Bacteroidales bacterium]